MSVFFSSSSIKPLEALNKLILTNRGALYEGDIFSVLKYSLYVVRLFKFTLADRALNCISEFYFDISFVDRL